MSVLSRPTAYLHATVVMSPLRIALLTYSTKPRGSVVHTLELAEALHDLGHHVCVYALDKDGKGLYRSLRCEVALVPAAPVDGDIDQLIRQRIQEFVDFFSDKDLSHDCYHAQDCLSANALLELRSQGRIPHFIRTIHHIEAYSNPYLQECEDKSIRHPDLCLCVSDRWQNALLHDYGILAPRILNGVNLDRFSPTRDGTESDLRRRLGLRPGPVFLTIGGIEPRKNSINLLRAFARVLQDYPQAQLVIAGGATLFDYQPYRDEFFAIAQTLDVPIGQALILPGVIPDPDLPALYRLASAFLFPSYKEGWGLVVLEAMASGIPVITSNQAPFTEFLSPHDALLVNPDAVEAIAQAMLRALDPAIATPLTQRGRAVASRYTWKTSARLHENHYYHLLHETHSWEGKPIHHS